MNETLSLLWDVSQPSQEAEMETQSQGRSDNEIITQGTYQEREQKRDGLLFLGGHFRTQMKLYRPGLKARVDFLRLLRVRGMRMGKGISNRGNSMYRNVAY